MTTLSFDILGLPASQGSKRAFRNPHTGRIALVESSKRLPPWREAVKHAAVEALDGGEAFGRRPVRLWLTFYLPRPKAHFRTGANCHLLRDAAPLYPATKPDVSKMARAVEDSLTDAGIYSDDSQVVELYAHKQYADRRAPGVAVTVEDTVCAPTPSSSARNRPAFQRSGRS